MKTKTDDLRQPEWPTFLMLGFCYVGWALSTVWIAGLWLPLGIVTTAIFIALHSSLTHELVHGHPFENPLWNEALVFPCLGLFIPYRRFRDLHLAHHQDSNLTDPYDDPESNYMDPEIWARLPFWYQQVLRFNNTLIGRMLVGPLLGLVSFWQEDIRAIRAGDGVVRVAWLLQIPAVTLVLLWVLPASIPLWAYLVAAYVGMSILKIRTYLEHQAHQLSRGRSVIIEDRGILSWLFLNNNLHAVHHMHPQIAWYDLPALYRARKERFQTYNDGYVYRSYAEIFRAHFIQAKDPVPHPLWHKD